MRSTLSPTSRSLRIQRCAGVLIVAVSMGLQPRSRHAGAESAGTQWGHQSTSVTARLRGVSAVSDSVAWASGASGTILRTVDGGRTWQARAIPGTESLDFRDVDAMDARTAYLLSIGSGEASRIYKTTDGGATWTLQFQNRDPKAFFDAMAFWDRGRGLVVGDSVGGQFAILRTLDGGRNWSAVPAAGLPPALPGEGAFAASGTSVAVRGTRHAWIGTGAAASARVLRTEDAGSTWSVSSTPVSPAGPTAGIFSIAFRDVLHGIIVGGDYKNETQALSNAAVSEDGGATWTVVRPPGLAGFRSAVTYVEAAGFQRVLAVGPSGGDLSLDGGRRWTPLPHKGFHAVAFPRRGAIGWAVGEGGLIARIRVLKEPLP
jgi:photosystem II stability/assembly factor-like uncharacterized protein